MSNKTHNHKVDNKMNRRNLISSLGKGLLAMTVGAIPGFASKPNKNISVKIHPDAIKRKSRGNN